MFPGYLFVRAALDKQRYIDLLKVQGVVRVLEDGWTRLTPVPDAEIDAIQQIAAAGVDVFPCAHLRGGERVRVLEGPLAGIEGVFVHDRPSKGRLVVSVDMLGRSIAVEMHSADVEPCGGPQPTVSEHARTSFSSPRCWRSPRPTQRAQSEVTIVPAVALGAMYDSNLFSAPTGRRDLLATVRPSLEGASPRRRSKCESLAYFDIQRSAVYSNLNTFDARRHAMVDIQGQASPVVGLGLAARYDRSETPGELNLDTGIMLTRQRARRLQVTPSISYRTDPRTTISRRYDWTSETLSGWPGGDMHGAARRGRA